jgi:ABC-2 type transport system ATP-binding protein
MSSIHVNFKHSPFLQKELILKFLETVDRDIKTTENRTSLVIDSEEKIPPIARHSPNIKLIYIELMYMNLL